MRIVLLFIMLISIALIPQGVFSKTVATINEVAEMYSIKSCAECHEDTHEEWKSSWHAKSLIDSRVLRTWRTFIKSGLDKSPQAKRKDLKNVCLPCHAPQTRYISDELATQIANLIVTAVENENQTKRENAKKELAKLNINCLVCHNLKATPNGKPETKAIYGPEAPEEIDTSSHEELGFKTIKSDFLKTPEFFAQCHHGCPPGVPSDICPTLYTSYKEHYLAKGGKKTCQDCHMKGEETKSHRFPGIYEINHVKEGVELTLTARPTEYVYHLENRIVPAVVVKVDVKNTAGHGIPHG